MKTFINIGGFRIRLDVIKGYHLFEGNPRLIEIKYTSGNSEVLDLGNLEKGQEALAELDSIFL